MPGWLKALLIILIVVVLLVIGGTLIFASEIPRLARHTESPVEESRSRFRQMLFDFHEGWMYVLGVGVAGGMTLRARRDDAT